MMTARTPVAAPVGTEARRTHVSAFDLRRVASYAIREALELRRDPIRLTLATVGSALLLMVMGYGISLDVNDLSYAVLDRDRTTVRLILMRSVRMRPATSGAAWRRDAGVRRRRGGRRHGPAAPPGTARRGEPASPFRAIGRAAV